MVHDDIGPSVGAQVTRAALLQRADELGDGRIVTHARGAVKVAERAIAVDDRNTGQPPPVTSDAPLTTAPSERAHVPSDHARPQPFRGSDAADADRAVEVRVGVDHTLERHAVAHEVLSLVSGAGSDGENACTRGGDVWIGLAHLREVVEAGDSAVIANRNDDQRAFEERTEFDR